MRRIGLILCGSYLALAALVLTVDLAQAQDPLKVAPNMYKLVFENERVRVMEVTFDPGQAIPTHSHPDHFVYVLEAGTLKITNGAGEVTEASPKVGDVMFIPAETHSAVNTGKTKARLLVTELKEPAPAPKPKPAETAPAAK